MDTTQEVKQVVCEICEKTVKEVYMCEKCEQMYCDNCGATYNAFTQIDYNCCKGCAKYNDRD